MATEFCDLAQNPAELARMLVELKLAESDEQPAAVLLSGGVSSSIFRVSLRRGDYCVKQALPKLKVAKDWYAPVDRIFAEADWLQTVSAIVPRQVPEVIAVDRRRGAFVMNYLAPARYANWKAELLAGRTSVAAGAQMGDLLGRCHAATARNPVFAKRFAHDANFYALRLEPYLVETARQHGDLAPRLSALIEATQTHKLAVIHGDVSPKNVLLGPDGVVLLDAECAWYGDPAFDLSFLLNHQLLKAVHRPLNVTGYFAIFEAIVSAYRAHVHWEEVAGFEERAAALLPGLLLARIDGKSPVEYLDAKARERVREVGRQLIAARPTRLIDIAAAVRAIC
jgi:aminoglycoside phosphotransferase (APT) family kinase protein